MRRLRVATAEEKIRIVLEGLRGEESIAAICRREGINSNLYYKWSKDFLEAGKKRLLGDIVREANSQEVGGPKRENEQLKQLVAELSLIGWGWYYLSTVMDDYSRYIISWQLFPTMSTTDVQKTLDMAVARTGVDKVKVKLRPRLLSDNGPCYLSKELKTYLDDRDIKHVRSAPYHPQTQGKIERYHRSIKNVITLHNYYFPTELEQAISEFVNYDNNKRYHESLNNLTPVDVFHGRSKEIISTRKNYQKANIKAKEISGNQTEYQKKILKNKSGNYYLTMRNVSLNFRYYLSNLF